MKVSTAMTPALLSKMSILVESAMMAAAAERMEAKEVRSRGIKSVLVVGESAFTVCVG